MAMPPQLVALTEGPSILLDKPILLVGRHQECDIQIQSRKVSRRHCCIAQVNDHLVVRDLCSTNGVRINGVRVTEGSLKGGDELTIGNFRYEVRWSDEPGEVAGPAPLSPVPPAAPRPHDDPLDSLDQPVPIDEGPSLPVARPAPDVGPSLLIPENLNLAPLSGEMKPKPPPAT
jgi:predicted component of type VI protein secretion system